ncbi:MAG TPA: hypothetical protein VH643_10045, partial [Gemmataceae bacterium]
MYFMSLFSLRKWARQYVKPTRQRKGNLQRPSFRPRLEVLEDRTLLAAYLVDLATDNNSGGQGQQDPNNAKAGDLRYCLRAFGKNEPMARWLRPSPLDDLIPSQGRRSDETPGYRRLVAAPRNLA